MPSPIPTEKVRVDYRVRMAAEVGWDIYPIGMDCNPSNVPHGTVIGLVLVE